MARPAPTARKVRREMMGQRDRKDSKAIQVQLDRQGPKAHRAIPVARKGRPGLLARMGVMVRKVRRAR